MKFVDIFDNATRYKLFQFSIMRTNTLNVIRNEVLMPEAVQYILDFGCGIGHHLLDFPEVNYLGIEPLKNCFRKANEMLGAQNTAFVLGDHRLLEKMPDSSYDLIIALGDLHQVNEYVMDEFIKESYRILRTGYRITTFNPEIHIAQGRISKWA